MLFFIFIIIRSTLCILNVLIYLIQLIIILTFILTILLLLFYKYVYI